MPSWTEAESGLRNKFEFTIKTSIFAPDQGYMNGSMPVAQFEGPTDDPELPHRQLLSFGKGWVTKDAGKSVVHESGKDDRNFQSSSKYWKFVLRAAELGAGDLLASRGDPSQAHVWLGLRFFMERETIKYGNGLDPQEALMPTKFLGVEEKFVKAASGLSVPASAVSSGPVVSIREQAIDAIRAAKANGVTDHDDLVMAALEISGAGEDEGLAKDLIDEEFVAGI